MFDECFDCGISGEKTKLFDVISEKGIIKLCKECAFDKDYPFLKKSSVVEKKEEEMRKIVSNLSPPKPEKRSIIYERLSRLSGIDPEEHKHKIQGKDESLNKQEKELKEIVEKNFDSNIQKTFGENLDLVHNFHWVIMRARRMKHLTSEQFAKAISEPVAAIKSVEKGVVPQNCFKFINKIENYLGIKIFKNFQQTSSFEEQVEPIKKEFEEEVSFGPLTTKMLTISDLKEMKDKRENEIFKKSNKFSKEDFDEEAEVL